MDPTMNTLSFHGQLLQRGFWLYVWIIRFPDGSEHLYVGKTGDVGSMNAQSLFDRTCKHFGTNKNNNRIRAIIEGKGFDISECSYDLFGYGPIKEELINKHDYTEFNQKLMRVEYELSKLLDRPVGRVLNKTGSKMTLDSQLLDRVKSAFAEHFPELR